MNGGKKFRSYLEYKNSGVSWLGDIPAHWEMHRLRHSVRSCLNGIWGDDPDGKNDLPCVRVADFNRENFRVGKIVPTIRSIAPNEQKQRLLRSGDLLLEKSGGGDKRPVGVVMLFDGQIPAVCSNFIAKMSVRRGFNSRFLTFLHSTLYAIGLNIKSIKQTTGIQNLDSSTYLTELVAFPPPEEQTAIARFLDWATGNIDGAIAAKEKVIALLSEQKKAIIHRAITRGLDSSAALKPSGVPYLGDIPKHWNVMAVKNMYNIQLGKMLQNNPSAPTDIQVPYLKAKNVQWFFVHSETEETMWAAPAELVQFGIRRGDLLVCEGGEGGRCSIVKSAPLNCIIQNALHRVRPKGEASNEYLLCVMSAISAIGWFDAINNKATIAHFTGEKFGALKIPAPPITEQTAIVNYLNDKAAKITAAAECARREIALLREYRARLVSDTVTGKIDVRGIALKNGKKRI